MKPVLLTLLFAAISTGALAQTSKPTLGIGLSTTHAIGLEFEAPLEPSLGWFVGAGVFPFIIPSIPFFLQPR